MISKMNDKDVTEDQSPRNAEYFIFHVHYLAAFHLRIHMLLLLFLFHHDFHRDSCDYYCHSFQFELHV